MVDDRHMFTLGEEVICIMPEHHYPHIITGRTYVIAQPSSPWISDRRITVCRVAGYTMDVDVRRFRKLTPAEIDALETNDGKCF